MSANTNIPAGTIVRFECDGKSLVGYVTGRDELVADMLRVCTKPGTYFWVDRCLAEIPGARCADCGGVDAHAHYCPTGGDVAYRA